MTNADRIRNMSDEELACVIEKIKMCGGLIRTETTSAECNGCKDGYCCNVTQWLQSEAEQEEKWKIDIYLKQKTAANVQKMIRG